MLHCHKIETRAAARLKELHELSLQDIDVWALGAAWLAHWDHFMVRCNVTEIKRIVAISGVPLSFAFDTLWTLFLNKGPEFPFESSEDLAVVPTGPLLNL